MYPRRCNAVARRHLATTMERKAVGSLEGGSKTLVVLKNCTDAVSDWMLRNGLALNPSKSEVIEFDTAQALHKSNIQNFIVAGSVIAASDLIKSLGVLLDKRLSFDAQVDRTCHTTQGPSDTSENLYRTVWPVPLQVRSYPTYITETLYLSGHHRQTSLNYNVPKTASHASSPEPTASTTFNQCSRNSTGYLLTVG